MNLTINKEILSATEQYAKSKNLPLSVLVEEFLVKLIKRPKRKSIIDVVEMLNKPTIGQDANLKELFYKEYDR